MSQSTQDRRWVIDLEADEFGNGDMRQFEADVMQAMAEVGAILIRLGGAVQSYAVRRQDQESGLWFPVQIVFKWSSFVPGIRAPRPQPGPSAEPELEVEAEEPAEAGEVQAPDGEEPSGA